MPPEARRPCRRFRECSASVQQYCLADEAARQSAATARRTTVGPCPKSEQAQCQYEGDHEASDGGRGL